MRTYTCPRLYVKDMKIDFLATLEKNSDVLPLTNSWIRACTINAQELLTCKQNREHLLQIFITSLKVNVRVYSQLASLRERNKM